LQDHVSGFAPALARTEVGRALGRPLKELFGEFEDLPLAAASVAQVHRARLADGTAMIVKVRRPGIVAAVERDMRLLRLAVRAGLAVLPGLRRFRPLEIVAEIHANLRRETGFRLEARNALQLRRAFKEWEAVMVPAVFEALCTESVMVQELSGRQRIDDPSLHPLDKRLANVLVDAYLHQFFTLGMFHADPHGGNLFHTPSGRLCLHDFGMVGFLDLDTRRNLAALMQAFVN
jgi:ubiquinone biosynthesis protein